MTLKNKTHVYFMPGMCANPLIFERIKLNKNFIPHYLSWVNNHQNIVKAQDVKRPGYHIFAKTYRHAEDGSIDAFLGSIIPNAIMLPLGVYLIYV